MSDVKKRIAVISWGVKLPGEVKGYTRFVSVAEYLARAGFEVDLITSTFQHWEKAQRETPMSVNHDAGFTSKFIYEPGYKKNIDIRRMCSHHTAAKNLARYLAVAPVYDLIYCEIPPNDVAKTVAKYCKQNGVPFIIDINDLWPQAMRMKFDIPVLSDIAFAPFSRDADYVYRAATAIVGTSKEYARGGMTVYVGSELVDFDKAAATFASRQEKPENEFWINYSGTLGASYDIETLIEASKLLQDMGYSQIKTLIVGDGPDKPKLEEAAKDFGLTQTESVRFLGYQEHCIMAAYLTKSDIAINSLVSKAPQSIVNKVADYLAAACPIINTGSNAEFKQMIEDGGLGVNVNAEDSIELAAAIEALYLDTEARTAMSKAARHMAETEFDRARTYPRIVELVERYL